MCREINERVTTTAAEKQWLDRYQERLLDLQRAESSLLTRISFLQSVWQNTSLKRIPGGVRSTRFSSLSSSAGSTLQKGEEKQPSVFFITRNANAHDGAEKMLECQVHEGDGAGEEQGYIEMRLANSFFPMTSSSFDDFNIVLLPDEGLTVENREHYASISKQFQQVLFNTVEERKEMNLNCVSPQLMESSPRSCSNSDIYKNVEIKEVEMECEKTFQKCCPPLEPVIFPTSVPSEIVHEVANFPAQTSSHCESPSSCVAPSSLSSVSVSPKAKTLTSPSSLTRNKQKRACNRSPSILTLDDGENASFPSMGAVEKADSEFLSCPPPPLPSSQHSSHHSSQETEILFYEMNKAIQKKHQLKRRRVDSNLKARLIALQYNRSPHDLQKWDEIGVRTERINTPSIMNEEASNSSGCLSSSLSSPRRVSVGEILSVLEPVKEKSRGGRRLLNNNSNNLGTKAKRKKTSEKNKRIHVEEGEEATLASPIEIEYPSSQQSFSNALHPLGPYHCGPDEENLRCVRRDVGYDLNDENMSVKTFHSHQGGSSAEALSFISWGNERFRGMLSYTRSRERRLAKFHKERKIRAAAAAALQRYHQQSEQHYDQQDVEGEKKGYWILGSRGGAAATREGSGGEGDNYSMHQNIYQYETPPEFWSIDFPSFCLTDECEKESK